MTNKIVVKTEKPNVKFYSGTHKEIVLKMTRDDFLCGSKQNYMKAVKERLEVVYGLKMKFHPNSFKQYLEELHRLNFISIHTRI